VKVLRTTRAVRVADSNVSSLVAHAESVSNLFEKGFVARNDVLAAQVVLTDARQREIQARNALDLASASYNRYLVRPLTNAVHLEDLTPAPKGGEVNELTKEAFQRRPGLVVLAEQSNALRQQARSVRASALPSIGVSGSYLQLEQGRAVQAEAESVWHDLTLVAPISGVITTRVRDAGEVVAAGSPVFDLVNLDRL
jgi:outer membrane protein TolC